MTTTTDATVIGIHSASVKKSFTDRVLDAAEDYRAMNLLIAAAEGTFGMLTFSGCMLGGAVMMASGVGVWWTMVGGVLFLGLAGAAGVCFFQMTLELYEFFSNLINKIRGR